MSEIIDMNVYLKRMQKGMQDKLWFVNHVDDIDIVVDYGCADGTLLNHIHNIWPKALLIGVDISEDMLKIARANVPDAIFMNVDEFFNAGIDLTHSLLVLSSVVHEIYSYDIDPDAIMNKLFNMGFNVIAVRDMFLSERDSKKSITYHDYSNLINYSDEKQLHDFESLWGHINTVHNASHFLLKYKYQENWDRELNENYLPVYLETFMDNIPQEYDTVYLEHYCNPYIQKNVWNDFFVKFNTRTHAKLLIQRKYN